MGDNIKGRRVRVDIATTFVTGVAISALTQANPGVAASVAHGVTAGAIGYIDSVEGMTPLEGQAVRLSSVVTDAFSLESIDTTNMPAFTGTALFHRASAWVTLDKATSYEVPEGAADKLDPTTLLDDRRREENGLLSAQGINIALLAETVNGAAVALVVAAAKNDTDLLFRITLKNGDIRLLRGVPSLPGESVQLGQLGTSGFSVSIKGDMLKLVGLT